MKNSIPVAVVCGRWMLIKSCKLTFCAALIAPLVFSYVGPAGANIVVLDFEQTGCCTSTDYFENGVRVSPNYHYDFVPSESGFEGSTYIGVDSSGADHLFNPAFPAAAYQVPGPPGENIWPALWIDVGGQPFSILDFWAPSSEWELQSSGGGLLTSPDPTPPRTVSFSGAEWQNIEWLLFVALYDPGAPQVGLDHLRLDVPSRIPEPSTYALMMASLGVLGFVTRRKKNLQAAAA